jgi:nicotinate-nucleotide adenylyltransferase
MRLGIFGGTFDPPHVGHLIAAEDAAAALGLDRVSFIPTGTHPLKNARVEAPAELRLRMIRAATAGNDLFGVDGRELARPGPSYTVDTLRELSAENPTAELFLLIGADILAELHRWHRIEEVAERARIAVMSRPEAPMQRPAVELDLVRVDVTHVAISSSEIRERVRAGRPYRYLVPAAVYEIIERSALYRKPPPNLEEVRRR